MAKKMVNSILEKLYQTPMSKGVKIFWKVFVASFLVLIIFYALFPNSFPINPIFLIVGILFGVFTLENIITGRAIFLAQGGAQRGVFL